MRSTKQSTEALSDPPEPADPSDASDSIDPTNSTDPADLTNPTNITHNQIVCVMPHAFCDIAKVIKACCE